SLVVAACLRLCGKTHHRGTQAQIHEVHVRNGRLYEDPYAIAAFSQVVNQKRRHEDADSDGQERRGPPNQDTRSQPSNTKHALLLPSPNSNAVHLGPACPNSHISTSSRYLSISRL